MNSRAAFVSAIAVPFFTVISVYTVITEYAARGIRSAKFETLVRGATYPRRRKCARRLCPVLGQAGQTTPPQDGILPHTGGEFFGRTRTRYSLPFPR